MKKIVKPIGGGLCVRFSPEEIEIYKLKKGSIVNMEIKGVEKNGTK